MPEGSNTADTPLKMDVMNGNGDVFGVRRAMRKWKGMFAGTTASAPTKTSTLQKRPQSSSTDIRMALTTKKTPPMLQLRSSSAPGFRPAEAAMDSPASAKHRPLSTVAEIPLPPQASPLPSATASAPAPASASASASATPTTPSYPPLTPPPAISTSRSPTPSSSRQSTPKTQTSQTTRSTMPADYFLTRKSTNVGDSAGEEDDEVPDYITPSMMLPKSTITTTITATGALPQKKGLMYRLSTRRGKRWSACVAGERDEGSGRGLGPPRARGRV